MKKKLYLLIIPLIIVISTVIVIVYKNNYEVLQNSHTSKNVNTEIFSIMLETSANSGAYEQSSNNSWPTSGYTFNKNLSYCENGSTLTWNNANNTVSLGVNKTDKCYVYFDVAVSDITVAVSNKPTTVGMLANLNCTGATSTYNQQYNRIEISQLNDKANCTLNYTNRPSKDYLNAKIMELAWMTQGDGQVVQENGYRYEGQDPNNYVWFNDELWRIIGVFDSSSHGVSNTNLVKIIRANSIGGLVWDKSNANNWSTSSLKSLLNNEYLNSTNGTNGENCYGYSTNTKAKCDYRETGIKDGYRGMIKEVTWYLGGSSSSYLSADSMYNYERSSTTYGSNPSSISAKVGLMYASDYGYAAEYTYCSRNNYYLSNYSDYTNCTLHNWLYGIGNEWTLTHYSSYSNYVFSVGASYGVGNGNVDTRDANIGYGVRPSLYLDASVFVISGDGSESNPYIIGM